MATIIRLLPRHFLSTLDRVYARIDEHADELPDQASATSMQRHGRDTRHAA